MGRVERRSIPSRFHALPALAFSIQVPPDFVAPALPEEEAKFENPTFMMPLWLASSPLAAALVTVSVRPAYEDGSVIQWLHYLAEAQGLKLTTLMPGTVGTHAAIIADAEQEQDGTLLKFRIAALEDGGHLFIVMSMVPADLWPSFGATLGDAVASFALASPQGARAPLVPIEQ